MKFTLSTGFVVLAIAAITSTTSAYELWYKRCGSETVLKTTIPGGKFGESYILPFTIAPVENAAKLYPILP